MQTQLDDVTDAEMSYGKHKGKKFSAICRQTPSYVTWARTQIPNCGTELFRLVQFADAQRMSVNEFNARHITVFEFEQKWTRLRTQHREWMQRRTY